MYDAAREKDATMFGREIRDNRTDAEMLKEALEVAAKADVIVAALGESSEMSGESAVVTNLEMPDAQRDLLKAFFLQQASRLFLFYSLAAQLFLHGKKKTFLQF